MSKQALLVSKLYVIHVGAIYSNALLIVLEIRSQQSILSQFWRLEVQGQGIGSSGFLEALLFGLQTATFPLCLHAAFPLSTHICCLSLSK